MDDKLRKLITIYVDDHQDQMEVDLFAAAVSKKWKAAWQSSGYPAPLRMPEFNPGIAWVAFRGIEDGLKQELILDMGDRQGSLKVAETDLWWVERALAVQNQDLTRDLQKHFTLSEVPMTIDQEVRLERAFELLQTVWPVVGKQVRRLVKKVVMVGGTERYFRSGTHITAFGAVFFNSNSRWNAVHYFDSLLHESGHLSLMIKQTACRMLKNLQEKANSPFRSDPRWLNGILHAAFVLWRIVEGLTRLTQSSYLLTDEEHATVGELLVEYKEDLNEAIETLRDRGIFTEGGQIFFDELAHAADALCEGGSRV